MIKESVPRLAWVLILALLGFVFAFPAYPMTVTQPGTVLQNQTIAGNLDIEGAHRTLVKNVVVTGDVSIQRSNNVTLDHVTVLGGRFCVGKWTLSPSHGLRIYDCDMPNIGKGVTSGDHSYLWWDDDSTTIMRTRVSITIEAGLPSGSEAEWHFDSRNRVSRGNHTIINCKRASYAAWRWRSDVGGHTTATNGCYNNHFDRDTIEIIGAGRMLPSSSSTCNGSDAGCIGQWGATMDSCVISCPGSTIYWQGGMKDWQITNTKITGNAAIDAFDIHGSRIQTCAINGNVKFADSYGRPLWKAGDMVFCNNVVTNGTVQIAPALAAIPEGYVTVCGAIPPPTPEPPPAPSDTLRITVRADPPVTLTLNKIPAVITVVAK